MLYLITTLPQVRHHRHPDIVWYLLCSVIINLQITLSFAITCGSSHDIDYIFATRPLLYPPYPKDRGSVLWFYVEAARRNRVNGITPKPRDGLFSNLVHTLVVLVPWPDWLFSVVGQRARSQRHKKWFFYVFKISFRTTFLPCIVEGDMGIPPRPLVCTSVCPFVHHFSGFCTFADKSLEGNVI